MKIIIGAFDKVDIKLLSYDAKKKGQLRKQVKGVQKKQCLRRVVEGLFLSDAGPKSGCHI